MHHCLNILSVFRRVMYWGLSTCQQKTGGSLRTVKATQELFQTTILRYTFLHMSTITSNSKMSWRGIKERFLKYLNWLKCLNYSTQYICSNQNKMYIYEKLDVFTHHCLVQTLYLCLILSSFMCNVCMRKEKALIQIASVIVKAFFLGWFRIRWWWEWWRRSVRWRKAR